MFKKLKNLLIVLAVCLPTACSSPQQDVLKADKLAASSQQAYQAAVDLYQKALKALPTPEKREEARFKLGMLYFNNGDYAAATEQFRFLKSKKAQAFLARSLLKNSDFTGALEVFNKVTDKGDAAYLYDYGQTLEKNNLYDQALHLYTLVEGDRALEIKAKERIAAINLLSGTTHYAGVDEETKALIQKSPGLEAYPQASALYLLTDENMVLSEDNQLVSDFHYAIKILNDRGKEKFGEVSLTYDSTYEKLEVEYARTIKPDGTVVTVGDKNIRDVSLYLNYPLYSNARARIISMPEVVPGSVIEYKGKLVRSQLPNKKDFDTTYWLQADEPILFQKCTISVPGNRALKYKIINEPYNLWGYDMKPKVSEEKGRRIYSIAFKDVPQIIPEPLMPPLSRVDPYILFSTFQSWQDIYTWWQDLFKDKIVADNDIKLKVGELVKGKKTQEEKIRAIYNYCVEEIRYVAVEYGQAGYEPHKASDIFKNKYGDCKDKAILLVTMLQEAGIEAFPVLISTSDSLNIEENMPALLFNHAIAATKIDSKLVFMDATATTTSFSDLPTDDEDRLVLVFYKDRYELIKTPLFLPEHNKVSTRMNIQVNNDESITAWRKVDTEGVYQQAQRFWLKFTMPVLIEEALKQKAMSLAESAVLKKYAIKNVEDLNQLVTLEFSFVAPKYFIKAGKDRIMDQLSGMDDSLVVKDTRHYPIDFATLDFSEETIEVELPQHLAVKYMPTLVEVTNKWFHFISKYDLIGKHTLRFYRYSRKNEKEVSVAEYGAYKKIIQDMVSRLNQQVILEEIKPR